MAFKAVLTADEHKALPEAQRGFYKEKGQQFWLDVEPVGTIGLEDTGGLKKALQTERDLREKSEAAVKKFDGIEPDKYREMEKKIAAFADLDPDKKLAAHKTEFEAQLRAKYEDQHTQSTKKFQSEIEAIRKERDSMNAQLESSMVDAAIKDAVAKHKGSVALLTLPVKQMVRLKKTDDGKYVVRVLDADGSERLSTTPSNHEPMTVDELVKELQSKPEYARAFDGSGASGSGATGGSAGGAANGRFSMKESEAKSNFRGYMTLEEQARKAGQTVQLIPG